MVNQAKQVALNPRDSANARNWHDANDHLLSTVRQVGDAITGVGGSRPPSQTYMIESVPPKAPSAPTVHDRLYVREDIPAPPRPPPPIEISPPPRPPLPPETDDEEETRAFWERYPLPGFLQMFCSYFLKKFVQSFMHFLSKNNSKTSTIAKK